jgi:hypothetical protein
MDDRTKLSVWDKASKIRGKDPELYRKDINGYEIYWHSFGKKTDMGWIIKNTGRKTVNFNLEDFNAVSSLHQDEKPEKKKEKKDSKESKDSKDSKNSKESKDSKNSKDSKDCKKK